MENKTIKNVAEFVHIVIGSGRMMYHPIAHLKTLYRGHADKNWEAIPAAFRNFDDFLNERLYLNEFQRELPYECDNLSYFDVLVKAQHYGIPTRMLDFTMNPLVALYFACEKNQDIDGQVLIFKERPIFLQNEITFKSIIHYIFKYKNGLDWSSDMRLKLCKSIEKEDDYYFSISEEKIEDIFTTEKLPLFVLPKLTNNRIRAQQGAFAIFHTPLMRKVNGVRKFAIPMKDINVALKPTQRIDIPADKKKNILSELDCLGINKTVLFPELEHHTTDIVRRIRWSNKEINQQIMK